MPSGMNQTQTTDVSTDAARPFAFAGRCSTEDNQDPDSSRAWQLSRAEALIKPHGGEVVAEYFDIGQSRALPWQRRPRSAELLDAIRDPRRPFEAVVIGEPHRMFYGNQFGLIFPLFVHFGVELWVPEVGGRIDPNSDAHDMMMLLFGGLSKAERNRIKVRVRAAMAAQAATEGRFLGGRPPYGYRLVDVAPHPNPAKAADGRMLHQLAPDPDTAPVVQRIFRDYLTGHGLYVMAEALTREGVACPSAHDRARNPHRRGEAWAKSAVRAILQNPRYTGRQVWNRQRRVETLIDVDDVALGHATKMRWNEEDAWVWSDRLVHEPLISAEEFHQAQERMKTVGGKSADRRPRATPRPYLLRSLIHCGLCERRMQGTWNHGRPHYRCRFPSEYAAATDSHPKSVYVREDQVVPAVDGWLTELFDEDRRADTVDTLLAASHAYTQSDEAVKAKQAVARCDSRLSSYRAALDAGGDPLTLGKWIAEVTAEREAAAALAAATAEAAPRPALSRADVEAAIQDMGDAVAMLETADRDKKLALYQRLQVRLTYQPHDRLVHVTARPPTRVRNGVSEGGLAPRLYERPV